jgi:beta-glucosidase-like glycosyl hydrolase
MAAPSPATGVNEIVDEVTLMELYSPPFEAAVKTSTGVMCACTTSRDVAHMPARRDACSLPFGMMPQGRSGWFAVCRWHGLVLRLCHAADNRINGVWACENRETLKDMLKGPTLRACT